MGQLKYCDWCKDQTQCIMPRKLNHPNEEVMICHPCWATYKTCVKATIASLQSGPGHFVFVSTPEADDA